MTAASILKGLSCTDPTCKCQASVTAGKGGTHCPSHDDSDPSLSVNQAGSVVLVHCQTGCSQHDVIEALRNRGLWASKSKEVAWYDYEGYQVVRFEPKDFKQRRPDGNGGWIWKVKGFVEPTLYRLPELRTAGLDQIVFVPEGEKDVDRLRALGKIATCNSGGAKKFPPTKGPEFTNRRVVILPDQDDEGAEHRDQVLGIVSAYAREVRVVNLPGVKDFSEWADQGHTVDELDKLVEAAGVQQPGSQSGASIVVLPTADTGVATSIEWWWAHHAPVGALGLLDGDPNLGKSVILADFIASATTGRVLPDGSAPSRVGGAILFQSEDGYQNTILPRLMAAGADLSRVLVAHAADYGQPIVLPRDLALLEAAITRMGAVIVCFDPWEFYLDADILKGKQQREALEPVKAMIAERKIVLLGTRHLNQQSGQKAMYRGRGDMTGGAVARWGFIVGPDPTSENPDENRVMSPLKWNLAPKSRIHAVKYSVEEVTLKVTDQNGNAITAPRIRWNGVSDVTPDQVVGAQGAQRVTAKQIMEDKVLPRLQNGPILADEGWKIMEEHGIKSNGSITPARKALGIEATKEGMSGPWWWHLEGQEIPGQLEVVAAEESKPGMRTLQLRPKPRTAEESSTTNIDSSHE